MSTAEYLRIEGELTIYSAAQQHGCLMDALRRSPAPSGLDLANIKEIDTAGVQLLLTARSALVGQDGVLPLANASPELREVLGLLRLEAKFGFAEKRRKRRAK